MIPPCVMTGSSTAFETITAFSVPLESVGDGTCGDPVSLLATWTVSAGVLDTWSIEFYVTAALDTYPSGPYTEGTLVTTEGSPDTNTTRSVDLPLQNNTSGPRWFFQIHAVLKDPEGVVVHVASATYTRKGYDC